MASGRTSHKEDVDNNMRTYTHTHAHTNARTQVCFTIIQVRAGAGYVFVKQHSSEKSCQFCHLWGIRKPVSSPVIRTHQVKGHNSGGCVTLQAGPGEALLLEFTECLRQ